MEFLPPQQPSQGMVLCADCGIPIPPSSANLCLSCLRNSVDITDGIPKQATVNYCRNCERYLNPPATWVQAQLESRELLAICLKKLKGLNKVRLIDAGFIWTEPHSKRLRLKLTVQKEVLTATILQQVFEVEFVVQYGQCPDCTRLAAKNTWKAVVQVRQKVPHKRTFLYLEQLILKHNAHRDTISIAEKRDGLDFYYVQRAHAVKMCDFLASVVPTRMSASTSVVSMDVHTSTQNNKFTYSVEIAPVCKDELVCLPRAQAKSLGQMAQLVLCSRVTNSLRLLDPSTLQYADVTSERYWKEPFASLCTIPELVEFLVLDIEPVDGGGAYHSSSARQPPQGQAKLVAADAQVSPLNAATFGEADAVYHTRTHLGHVLQPGDTALGYHLRSSNFNSDAFDTVPSERVPDVVLVKKHYPDTKRRAKRRNWKLKSIVKDESAAAAAGGLVEEAKGAARGAVGRKGGLDGQRVERDYELFLRELEEDEAMRANVNLYRDREAEERRRRRREEKAAAAAAAAAAGGAGSRLRRTAAAAGGDGDETMRGSNGAADDEGDEDEVIDDGATTTDGGSEWGDDDDDGAPRVRIEELLDDMQDMNLDADGDERIE